MLLLTQSPSLFLPGCWASQRLLGILSWHLSRFFSHNSFSFRDVITVKMVGKWSESQTLKFIYYYRIHECLWNTKSDFYSMKDARAAAYADLVIKMAMPDFDVRGVKVKIKNLRAHYISELKKKRQCAQLGRIYEPTLYWFKEMDSFLREIVSDLPTMQNPEVITADSIFDCSSIYENGIIDEDSMGKASPIFHMETSAPAIPTPPPKQRYKPGPASKKRKRAPPPVTQEKTDDEFEVFGKSVAAQLRMLNLSRALRAQIKIQAILTEERIQELETKAPSPEPLGPFISEVQGSARKARKMNGASSSVSVSSRDASSPPSLVNIPDDDISNADEASANSSSAPIESSVPQSSAPFESKVAQSSAPLECSVAQSKSSAPIESSVAQSSSLEPSIAQSSPSLEPSIAQSSASLESSIAESTTASSLPVKIEPESEEVKSTLQEPDDAPPPKRSPSPKSNVSQNITPKSEEPKTSSKVNYHIIKAECEVITLDEDDPLEGFG